MVENRENEKTTVDTSNIRRLTVSAIRFLLTTGLFCWLIWASPNLFLNTAYAGEWVTTATQSQNWVDTSHWEDTTEWVDTSHWETHMEDVWVESGYWNWVSDYYWTYSLKLLRSDIYVVYVSTEGQLGWPYVRESGDRVYTFDVVYIFEAPARYRAEVNAAIYEKVWYQEWYSTPVWVDTSHWEQQQRSVWIESGNWESRKKWVESGYWAEPLHGTITVQKTPSYVFTKWHWLTPDGMWHAYINERAHVRIIVSWNAEKPVDRTSHYAELARSDDLGSIDRITIASHDFLDGEMTGEMNTVTEYEHAGTAKHTFEFHAVDGSVAKICFEIPVNGFNGANVDENMIDQAESAFTRSVKDRETIVF